MRQSIKTVLAVFVSFAAIILLPCAAMSQENADGTKAKVLIYYFQNMTRSSDYGYYSYIIPDSISIELKKTTRYDIQSFPVVIDYIEDSASDDAYKKRIGFLSDRGKEFNADFVIMGSYYIEDRKIYIKTQIFNVQQQKIKDLRESSDELGVMLLVIIDNLSQKINSELGAGTEAIKEATRTSPYIPFYSHIRGFTLGMNFGFLSMLGQWGDIYQKTEMISIYAGYGFRGIDAFKNSPFLRNIMVTAEYSYFNAGNMKTQYGEKFFTSRGFLLNGIYDYPILSYLSLSAGVGFGIAASKVEVMASGPGGPGEAIISIKTTDPSFSLAAGANLNIAHIQFTLGYSLRGIFLKKEPTYLSIIYVGAGYIL